MKGKTIFQTLNTGMHLYWNKKKFFLLLIYNWLEVKQSYFSILIFPRAFEGKWNLQNIYDSLSKQYIIKIKKEAHYIQGECKIANIMANH